MFSSSSGVISTSVTATVDSVGPYVLITLAFGNLWWSFETVAVVSTSPQKRNTSKLGINSPENFLSDKHISTKDGVDTHTLMSDCLKCSNIAL